MRFTYCLNLTWQYLLQALNCLHDITQESVAALTDHFSDAFVCKMLHTAMILCRNYDIQVWHWCHFVWWIQVEENGYFMFMRHFQCDFGWNQVKYARITITHVCFIAWTLFVALRRCLNTQPSGIVFKQLPRDPASVNARKNMCDPYINTLFSQTSYLFSSQLSSLVI